MSDFKWEMQQRVDAGMSPDEAYNATRDSYADIWDNRDKTEDYWTLRARRTLAINSGEPIPPMPKRPKEFRCNSDESGGVRDDDASAGGA